MNINALETLSLTFPIEGNFDIIKSTENIGFNSILDVGTGNAAAAKYFALQNKQVTSIGLKFDHYQMDKENLKKLNITLKETSIEELETSLKYDAIWASHIIEHTRNVGFVLDKFFELLAPSGWLFVMVPPYKNKVVGAHISNGWNLGQLMYNLLLSGFDIKNGHFVKHGYNICAFVQKKEPFTFKNLISDSGDIINTKDLWPIDVYEGFDGNLKEVNWFKNFKNYSFLENKLDEAISLNKQLKESTDKLKIQNNSYYERNNILEKEVDKLHVKNSGLFKENTVLKNDIDELQAENLNFFKEIKKLNDLNKKYIKYIESLENKLEFYQIKKR